MSAYRLLFLVLSLASTVTFGSDKFLRAEDLGSWNWSGFNLQAARLTELDIVEIVESGAKIARFHLEAKRCSSCTQYVVEDEDLQRLSKIVGYARAHGLKIIIVLDPSPHAREADFWEVEDRLNSLVLIWTRVARKFANEATVAAFDLLNEPHPPDETAWIGGSEMWPNLAKRLAEAIRHVAPSQVLIVESSPIALPGAFEKLKPLPFDNVLYSFHFYEPHRLTHQGILGFPLGLDYPGEVPNRGYWDKKRLSNSLEAVRKFKARYGVPVQVGEVGFIRWAPRGARSRYIKDFLDLVYQENWGWLYHSYREWEGWDAEIDSNLKSITTRSSESRDFQLIKSFLNLQK